MTNIFEVYVTKRSGLDSEAQGIIKNLNENLGFNLSNVRVFNRYLVKGLNKEEFSNSLYKVFAEKNADEVYLSFDELNIKGSYLITELLPGQFDMRANAAMECLNLVTSNFENEVKHQRLIDFCGTLDEKDYEKISDYLINKVEMRKGTISDFENLFIESKQNKDMPMVYDGFISLDEEGIADFHKNLSLAMTIDDLRVVVDYFKKINRNPNETEIKLLDTYWSDHCRHTTFNTELTKINIEDEEVLNAYNKYLKLREEIGRTKPVTLMDLGTFGARYLKAKGKLNDLDESDEINACSIKRNIRTDMGTENYLIQFKNETHNHPTEIEPFGGAATCLGGAIRDPLSGRAFVYQAMRVTGAANPLEKIEDTLEGKLPQKNIVTTAAKGYSSYGNQIGLAAGVVHEIYHPGYKAKRMEVGAVIGSTPYDKVMRLKPEEGDVIILVGGRTGRDGVGGATGSSKSHDTKSIETSGAEVQKGNAPIERKIQRLMRNEEVKVLIKKCNDFGAGGVAVAVGELADGLEIDLDKVKLKYKGLTATETAVSESQERMAILINKNDLDKFKKYLDEENLEFSEIAKVTSNNKLIMKWNNEVIVDLDRDFLDSAGAQSYQEIVAKKDQDLEIKNKLINKDLINEMLRDLNNASQRALNEMFDSSNGASTKVLPFGGRYQDTESSYMACHIPLTKGISKDVSVMSYGFDPFISSKNQFKGGYLAVVESLSKMAVSGAKLEDVRLSFQEYFEKLGKNPEKWGKPFKSILGALMAQIDYEVPAIGGKDSMSGTFNDLNVPPTLISFACNVMEGEDIIVNTLKGESDLYLLKTEYENSLPKKESFLKNVEIMHKLNMENNLIAADVTSNELLMTLFKMSFGNRTSFNVNIDEKLNIKDVASFIVSVKKGTKVDGIYLGQSIKDNDKKVKVNNLEIDLVDAIRTNKDVLGKVFNENVKEGNRVENIIYNKRPEIIIPKLDVKPRVIIPVFPGSNCEYDLERAFSQAGAEVKIFILKNRDKEDLINSSNEFINEIKKSHIMMLPGGFSAGDEPDGSGKFIGNVFRNELIGKATMDLIDNRNGLILGICNGFQALIKLGLVPYGKIIEPTEDMPTLTNNVIGKHIDMISRVRIASTNSPWLNYVNVGEVYSVPISHGEGRFIANDDEMKQLIENGQIITQYCDLDNNATMEAPYNPNGSFNAVEGIVSKDGRILGKMGHNERWCEGLYKNYDDNFDMKLFRSGVEYFTKK